MIQHLSGQGVSQDFDAKTCHNVCKQCGECCRKGGPLLHIQDMPLVEQKHIDFAALVTLRVGEIIHDPILQRLAPLQEEAIKIAGTGEVTYPWHCVFHKDAQCSIHNHRPIQCQTLFCTDTTALEATYTEQKLTRRDILAHAPEGWLALAEAHEESCPVTPFVTLSTDGNTLCTTATSQDIAHIVRYDSAFRDLAITKARIPANILPCLFGRPLAVLLRTFLPPR